MWWKQFSIYFQIILALLPVYSDAFFTRLKILIEVDHLQGVATPYLQIKGTNKDIVSSAGSALNLDGSYTTKVWLEVFSQSMESICIYLTYFLYLFSFMVSFWFAELSSNYFGELTSWWKCFGWYSQSTSCKAAGTGWVHPVSGMFAGRCLRMFTFCTPYMEPFLISYLWG